MREFRITGMGSSIHLHDEARRNAGEISDIGSNGMLAPEAFRVNRIMSQPRPQNDLGIRHLSPQAFGQNLRLSLSRPHPLAPSASRETSRSAPPP
jgi:hypothetical protein